MMKQERYFLVDGIRGLAVVNMVVFHFLYDIYMIYGRDPDWYFLPAVHIWQQMICRTFILVAGFVWRFGEKNSLKRGLFFHLCGALISLVTWLFVPAEAVWFGILSFMGSAVLLMLLLHKIFRRVWPFFGLAGSLICFWLFKEVSEGALCIGSRVILDIPAAFYRIRLLTFFGFPFPGFSSSDYFPLFPWMFLFLAGYFLYPVLEKREFWKRIRTKKIPVFSWLGQKSIWIYLIHQPVCMGILLTCSRLAAIL